MREFTFQGGLWKDTAPNWLYSLETLKRIFKTTAKGHQEAKQQDLLQGTSTKKDDYSSSKKIKRLTVKGEKIKIVTLNSCKAVLECKSHLTHFQLQVTVQEAVVDSRLHDLQPGSEDEHTLMVKGRSNTRISSYCLWLQHNQPIPNQSFFLWGFFVWFGGCFRYLHKKHNAKGMNREHLRCLGHAILKPQKVILNWLGFEC